MTKFVALGRTTKAPWCRAPIAARYDMKITDKVLIYRKINERWEGPFVVTNMQGKVIFIDQESKSKQYSVENVRPLSKIRDDDTTAQANQDVDPSNIVSRDPSENNDANRPNVQSENYTERPHHHT